MAASRTGISGLLAVLLGGTFMSAPALAATHEVGPGQRIQDAIDRAAPGDTIRVAPGEYAPFEITRNGIRIMSAQPGRATVMAPTGRAISAYGQSDISIEGFRVVAPGGDGVAVGGAPGRFVSGLRIAGVTVANAGRDGIKLFQMRGSEIVGNRIERAGTLGAAGSGGNGNGDGGIDCVTCEGTLFQSNVVNTQGWAALMLKTGSTGNRIIANTLRNSDPRGAAMSVGGVSGGAAAGAAGVLGDAGSEASGNIVEGNTLASADCALVFIDARNNRVGGNRISQRRNCPTSAGSNTGAANVAATRADVDTPLERNVDGVTRNLGDTPEQLIEAVRRGEAGALQRLERLLSGERVTRRLGRAINRGTWDVSNGIDGVIDGAEDAIFDPIEDAIDTAVDNLACSMSTMASGALGGLGGIGDLAGGLGGMASTAMEIGAAYLTGGLSTIISGLGGLFGFGGGDATVGMQKAQQGQLFFQSVCDSQMASNQIAMIRPISRNVVKKAGAIGREVAASLGLEDAEDDVASLYQDAASADMTADESAAHAMELRARTDKARLDALNTAALSVEAEREYSVMADRALALSQSAPGQTSTLQALAQMERAKEAALSSRNAAAMALGYAALLAEEETRAGERLAIQRRERLYGVADGGAEQNRPTSFEMFQ